MTSVKDPEFIKSLRGLVKDPYKFQRYCHQKYLLINDLEMKRRGNMLYRQEKAKRNETLNRYYNILPFDKNRVVLSDPRLGPAGNSSCNDADDEDEDEEDGYINASWILAPYEIPRIYIATQGPTMATLIDFWRMVVEQRVPVIVCLTPISEDGFEKCARYWPLGDEIMHIRHNDNKEINVKISNIKKEKKDSEADSIVRTILIQFYRNEELIEQARVTQLQFLGWPDHGVPKETSKVINLIRLTRQLQEVDKPVLVHCSAGCGRTGTFCVIDSAEILLKMHDNLAIDPIFLLIDEFRKQRTTMVQSLSQYSFCYKALLDFIDQEE
ncbi:protein-tyrosine phosphatase-like protein [Cokeromyces recurvatus]|uniref:protein-tyrosine phosphatase-like protein n=1 Tax=Cokeromyces recurvatus TaxID=90255 RepID=UPI00221EEFDC|nr:protein-tyrosine phosphatase-like protein [Cokeromyces recurvatus]KAI7899993.1 protein-tyrosine phosphatase-like protein [Cokeromyces recurvatus]